MLSSPSSNAKLTQNCSIIKEETPIEDSTYQGRLEDYGGLINGLRIALISDLRLGRKSTLVSPLSTSHLIYPSQLTLHLTNSSHSPKQDNCAKSLLVNMKSKEKRCVQNRPLFELPTESSQAERSMRHIKHLHAPTQILQALSTKHRFF